MWRAQPDAVRRDAFGDAFVEAELARRDAEQDDAAEPDVADLRERNEVLTKENAALRRAVREARDSEDQRKRASHPHD